MPTPQASILQQFVRTQFASSGITLPRNWSPPAGEAARQFAMAFSEADPDVAPEPVPPALFYAASRNHLHVETQRSLSRSLGEYIDGICDAITHAWKQWHAAASMTGIVVNSSTASGGVVDGPTWYPLIMPLAPQRTPIMLRYSTAIATAISDGWRQWQASLKIPGLPFYPPFVLYPAAIAPPTANVPTSIAKLTQVTKPLSQAALKAQMIRIFDNPHAQFADELFDSVAGGFEQAFMVWRASTKLTKVMGTGPVPSYAPPTVPAGPVVSGTATMLPGGLA